MTADNDRKHNFSDSKHLSGSI